MKEEFMLDNTEPAILEMLSYSDWEDGEVTPHGCSVNIVEN